MIDSKVTKVTNRIFMAEYQRKQIIVIALSKKERGMFIFTRIVFSFWRGRTLTPADRLVFLFKELI